MSECLRERDRDRDREREREREREGSAQRCASKVAKFTSLGSAAVKIYA